MVQLRAMKPSLQKLQKFLKLEAERNYDNRAVVGGLERILTSWQAEAIADFLPQDLIDAVTIRLRDYANISPNSRAEALEGLWKRIQRETGEAPLPLQPAHREETPPAPQPPRQPFPEQKSPTPPQPKVSPAPPPPAALPPEGPPAALGAPITVLPGVGPRHGQTLARLNMITLGDMLYYFPRRYDDYTQLKPINRLSYGEEVTIIGTIERAAPRSIRSGKMQIVEAVISDGSGAMRITWFNQPWIAKRLHAGMLVVLSGKIEQYLGRLTMNNPEWEPLEQQNLHTNRIVPVYPLAANITQRWLRRLMFEVITYWAPRLPDPLPISIRDQAGLMDLAHAILQTHFPESRDALIAARHRLAFDEIFLLQLGVLRQKRHWQDRSARTYAFSDASLKDIIAKLPFQLTSAQTRTLADLQADMASGHPMNRLLQGDVGSGKTIIAAIGIALIAQHGAQSALMAPTSILAEQHYRNLLHILGQFGLPPSEVRLILGSTPEADKQEIRSGLADGSIKLVIGTHALIQDPITFADLQFIVVDEQHRFGVEQRALLRAKGENPHLLVMTATPIPRSLALTVYGDLDLSVMDEMPPGRQPIETQVYYPRERERAYAFIRNQLDQGRQAFIIYPLVEESERSEALAAVEEHARLQEQIFPRYRLGLLHGRMKPEEKESVMSDFRDSQTNILVSTSVVEVGVDVPNATVILVEGANRFGLAQLHQFRGRVGRGQYASYCILIPETPDAAENQRLQAMVETNDGFVLAERDLEQRGPGEFLGARQSGYSELRMANIMDVRLIEKARLYAQALFESDPDLNLPDHKPLLESMQRFWEIGQGDLS
ncbi:MAG: ATP-dependent DNA helicase RecG [Anaerolineales bacterium]|nr:ATP-dependent DNA helicase RecG [Anaerolineales bacterium]